jgi:hypothetical protein
MALASCVLQFHIRFPDCFVLRLRWDEEVCEPFTHSICALWPVGLLCLRQVKFSNGDEFDGQTMDGRLFFGLYTFADPAVGRYQGHFDLASRVDDKDALQYFGDGSVYRGQFTHGEISGRGVVGAIASSPFVYVALCWFFHAVGHVCLCVYVEASAGWPALCPARSGTLCLNWTATCTLATF